MSEPAEIPSTFWRFAFPDEDGQAVNLNDLSRVAWFEVNAADVIRLWPDPKMRPQDAIGGETWPLALMAVEYIRRVVGCNDHEARLTLQRELQNERIRARGPLEQFAAQPLTDKTPMPHTPANVDSQTKKSVPNLQGDSNITAAKTKRGPKGGLTKQVSNKMFADLRSGKLNLRVVDEEGQESLAARYGVRSRSTAMEAWKSAIDAWMAHQGEFDNSTNSDN